MRKLFITLGLLISAALPLTAQEGAELPSVDSVKEKVEAVSTDPGALKALVSKWRAEMDAQLETIADLKAESDKLSGDEAKAKAEEIVAAKAELKAMAERMQVPVNALSELGEDVTDENAFIIEHTGLTIDNVDVGAIASIVERWATSAKQAVIDNGPGIAFNLLKFVVILLAFRVIAGILERIVGKALSSSKLKVSNLLHTFTLTITRKVTLLFGLVIALNSGFGIDMGPVIGGLAVFGFVIGFALQDTLSNFASGVMLLLYRPYDVGDVVSGGGVTGKVTSMSLVSTTFTSPDNQVEIVPNSLIWGGVITNKSANSTRRVDFTVGIGYDDDIDLAIKVLTETTMAHPAVLKDPEPTIKVSNLGDSSVDIIVRPWCAGSDYWDVHFDLTKGFKQALDAASISIPYPQRDLHLVSTPDGVELTPRIATGTDGAKADKGKSKSKTS